MVVYATATAMKGDVLIWSVDSEGFHCVFI